MCEIYSKLTKKILDKAMCGIGLKLTIKTQK